jgi:hypothetical protein
MVMNCPDSQQESAKRFFLCMSALTADRQFEVKKLAEETGIAQEELLVFLNELTRLGLSPLQMALKMDHPR